MIPILLDTDIGTDVDDAYALVLAATSPELDLRGVTIVNNDVELRGRITRKLLQDLRYDCPVALGAANRLDGTKPPGWHGNEGEGIELERADFAGQHAKDLIRDLAADGCRTIVGIGQMTNIALALRELPAERRRELTIYQMATSFRGFGRAAAEREHNAVCDLLALKETLESGAKVKLVGLNVTRLTTMTRDDLRGIEKNDTPLARDLAGMHRVWFDYIGRDASPMHDPLTVAAVFAPDLVRFEGMRAEVLVDEEAVVFHGDGTPNCEVAVDVDSEGFTALFLARIAEAASR